MSDYDYSRDRATVPHLQLTPQQRQLKADLACYKRYSSFNPDFCNEALRGIIAKYERLTACNYPECQHRAAKLLNNRRLCLTHWQVKWLISKLKKS